MNNYELKNYEIVDDGFIIFEVEFENEINTIDNYYDLVVDFNNKTVTMREWKDGKFYRFIDLEEQERFEILFEAFKYMMRFGGIA